MSAGIMSAGISRAQEAENDPWAGIEEMIVTGSGAGALLTPQSTSAVAFDASALEAYGVEDIGDIAAYVPNLEIRSQNATNASFFVRGVGLQDFGANASSAVPIIQDGLIRNPSAAQLVGLFDVGGLSVLRGPQGSGNYRNASAGAILVETAKPETTLSGFAQVTLATIYSHDAVDAPRYDIETAVTSAVYEDIVSVRLSARYSHENPFVENGCANRVPFEGRTTAAGLNDPDAQLCESIIGMNAFGSPVGIDGEQIRAGFTSGVQPFLDKRLGDVDDYGVRAQVRIQPPDTGFDWTVRAEISNLNRDSTVGAHIGGAGALGGGDTNGYRDPEITLRSMQLEAMGLSMIDARNVLSREIFRRGGDTRPFSGNFDSPGRTISETLTLSTTAIQEFDDYDLEVNAGYIDYRKSEVRDTDLSPNKLFSSSGDDQAWEVYADFEFSGEEIGDTPLAWSAGGYTLLENVEARLLQSLPTGATRENKFDQEIYSFGAFLDGSYELLEGFTFSAGARYNWEQKRFNVQDTQITGFLTGVDRSENQLTWDSFSGFAEIRYEFTEEIGAYMKYSRGFKAGHFNPSRPDAAEIPGQGFADPEKIDALEWGLDFAGWEGRVSGNAALFYYNYKNYQVFRLTSSLVGVFREIQNAKKARNLGAELGLTLRPLEGFVPEAIEGLTIKFEGGWLDTEYLEFTNVDLRQFPGFQLNVTIDNTGNQLINAAQLQATLTVNWPLVLERFGTITPQYVLSWTDDTPFDPNRGRGQLDSLSRSRFPPYTIGNRAYAIHNVRLAYEPPGETEIRIAGWCRNVTDQRFENFSVDLSSFALVQLHFPGDPRICGADIRYSW
jgi:iron complex outermembrane receptor protein